MGAWQSEVVTLVTAGQSNAETQGSSVAAATSAYCSQAYIDMHCGEEKPMR